MDRWCRALSQAQESLVKAPTTFRQAQGEWNLNTSLGRIYNAQTVRAEPFGKLRRALSKHTPPSEGLNAHGTKNHSTDKRNESTLSPSKIYKKFAQP